MTEPAYTYTERSQVIHTKKCRLYRVILTPDGTNNSYLDIYDGDNTSEPKVMRLRVQANRSYSTNFSGGLPLRRGLYLSFGANLEAVTVISKPEE